MLRSMMLTQPEGKIIKEGSDMSLELYECQMCGGIGSSVIHYLTCPLLDKELGQKMMDACLDSHQDPTTYLVYAPPHPDPWGWRIKELAEQHPDRLINLLGLIRDEMDRRDREC